MIHLQFRCKCISQWMQIYVFFLFLSETSEQSMFTVSTREQCTMQEEPSVFPETVLFPGLSPSGSHQWAFISISCSCQQTQTPRAPCAGNNWAHPSDWANTETLQFPKAGYCPPSPSRAATRCPQSCQSPPCSAFAAVCRGSGCSHLGLPSTPSASW